MTRRPYISPERAFGAFSLVCKLSAPTLRGNGYRLFYAKPPNAWWLDLGPGDHAVVGSHERCNLVNAEEPGIRTRQTLVTCSRLEDGTPSRRPLIRRWYLAGVHQALPSPCPCPTRAPSDA